MLTSRTTSALGTGLWGYHPCEFSLRTVSRTWTTRDGSASRTALEYELDFVLDGKDDPAADRLRTYRTEKDREAFVWSNLTEITWAPPRDRDETRRDEYDHDLAGQVISSLRIDEDSCVAWFEDAPSHAWLDLPLPTAVMGARELVRGDPGYWDALLAAIGAAVVWVDVFLDQGFVVAFADGWEWRVPAATLAVPDGDRDPVVSGEGFFIRTADEPFATGVPPVA